ncbi:kynureninase [Aaosphaeria arxii CBS 175.79]|uniref:Kynureninase n=1 Tax=Aaosphaeria arxii CBS 175.79 TaxID=1450172 RepID=A0A6A5Y2Q1_9PLEO|nr:kynureninase [Aaosphaeria arxii CBS 175.79]KAF2019738.1 kynureninase [Aaosphaeria arxii CBS 175.79]
MPQAQDPFADFSDKQLFSEDFARKEDANDPLSKLRNEFIIPTKGDLKHPGYGPAPTSGSADRNDTAQSDDAEEAIYFCGNSLGLQPKRTREYIHKYLDTWSSKGVFGHFKELENGHPPWLNMDDAMKDQTSKLVGALPEEVVVMETLTANLHFLMASFYKPTATRYKIIIEGKAFPSDHYAALSQLAHHNLPPDALVTITPPNPDSPYLSDEHILSVISQHAASTALVLLPGIQFYSGQYFDIKLITHHCHLNDITIGWDLAHAVGNVPVKLHEWNVDFAAWCNYKYMNGGPGVIGGLFVHERHGKVESSKAANGDDQLNYRPRLSGWWGGDKGSRFRMENQFVPIPGASGFQVSNPSALDLTAVKASLDIFALTDIDSLRARSLRLTRYLERLLLSWPADTRPYRLLTPSNPDERGAQISVLLNPGLLDSVQANIESNGVVVDERKPDVLRVAPAPLYNSFWDIYRFYKIFKSACEQALASSKKS